jgi:uncharacterized GH25 family protein
MKIADRLPEKQKQQLEKMKSPKKKKMKKRKPSTNLTTKQKTKENLSYRDIEELMGKNRQVLHRKRGGAWG